MTPRPEPNLKVVKQWVKHAEEDLRLAKHAFTLSSGVPFNLIAYHAQQCAEKYLKALLIYHKYDFPYTHDIDKLIKICMELESFDEDINCASELTVYGVTARYPSEIEEVTKEEALRMVALAEMVERVI